HISGRHYRDYHLMLDEQSEAIFATTDQIAERVRKLGGITLRSISQISKLQTIKDNNEEYVPPREMLRELMEDNKHIAAAMRKAHDVCDDNDDIASASLLENFIDETERRTWFLFEASRQEGSNAA
ncbi:MAG TPA: DNA starvation/stationary phase protection protein, partial [Bradyrhizobium sp.]|nr:DNA starvation/stationary phase protection protein [Bradyrhizobium sp.]